MESDDDVHPRDVALILVAHSLFLDSLWLSSILLRNVVVSEEWNEVIFAVEKTSWLLLIVVSSFIPWTTARWKRENNA